MRDRARVNAVGRHSKETADPAIKIGGQALAVNRFGMTALFASMGRRVIRWDSRFLRGRQRAVILLGYAC